MDIIQEMYPYLGERRLEKVDNSSSGTNNDSSNRCRLHCIQSLCGH